MLEFFHKYQRSIIVYIFMGVILASMVMFGIDLTGGSQAQYAIKVNDTEFSFRDVAQQRRQFEERLRQQFGDSYPQMLALMAERLDQEIVDQMIENELLLQVAQSQNLAAHPDQIRQSITEMFQGSFSPQLYQNYLAQFGLSAIQFEEKIAEEVQQTQLLDLLSDFSTSSEYEAQKQAQALERRYDVAYTSISTESMEKEVETPTEDVLKNFYEEHALEYEEPAKAQYQAIRIAPKDMLDTIEISPEEIELYYADNAQDFKLPPQAKVSHIQINYGQESTPEALNTVREEAEKAHQRAIAGEDFGLLVKEFSDDITTKGLNGSLGWLSEGTRGDAVEKAALELGVVGITDIVETDYGFHIVAVEEFKEASTKELADVSAEIESKLKRLEAPAYALAHGEELLVAWQESNVSLDEFAKTEELDLIRTDTALSAGNEVGSETNGLTAEVLNHPDETQLLIELGDSVFVVQIQDYQEAFIPALESVRPTVLAAYVKEQAKILAEKRASDLISQLQSPDAADFSDVAKASGLEVGLQEGLSQETTDNDLLQNPDIRESIFRTGSAMLVTDQPVAHNDSFYIVAVQRIETPERVDLQKPIDEYMQEATEQNKALLRDSLIRMAKLKAEIDIAPSLIGQ